MATPAPAAAGAWTTRAIRRRAKDRGVVKVPAAPSGWVGGTLAVCVDGGLTAWSDLPTGFNERRGADVTISTRRRFRLPGPPAKGGLTVWPEQHPWANGSEHRSLRTVSCGSVP